MAKKPPICISKTPPIIPSEIELWLHLVWTNGDPAYPPMNLDETILLVANPLPGPAFGYGPIDTAPSIIFYSYGYFPFAEPYNYIEIHACDSEGNRRWAGCYFEPSRSPPFDQIVTEDWFTSLPLDTLIAHFTPA